jgi:hypothetical protein
LLDILSWAVNGVRVEEEAGMKIAAGLVGATIVMMAGQITGANAETFTISTEFTAATVGLTTDDYGSYSAGTLVPSGSTLGTLTYSFSTASGLGGVVTNLYDSFSGNSLAAKQVSGPLDISDFFLPNESFTVTFPTPVTAVGIFSNVNLPLSSEISTTSGDTGSINYTVYDTLTFTFLGFTSTTPFTSATFSSTSPFNIPMIEYGAAAVAAIPEPSTWAMMLIGFAGLGLAGYRRAKLGHAPLVA